MSDLKYQNSDIRNLALDLVSVLSGLVPGTGVVITGFDIDPVVNVISNELQSIDEMVASISICVSGDNDATINGEIIPSGTVLNFARGLDKPYPAGKFTIDATNTVVIVTYNKVVIEELEEPEEE